MSCLRSLVELSVDEYGLHSCFATTLVTGAMVVTLGIPLATGADAASDEVMRVYNVCTNPDNTLEFSDELDNRTLIQGN